MGIKFYTEKMSETRRSLGKRLLLLSGSAVKLQGVIKSGVIGIKVNRDEVLERWSLMKSRIKGLWIRQNF